MPQLGVVVHYHFEMKNVFFGSCSKKISFTFKLKLANLR